MIEINGKVYRNLQEQVEKNKDDILRLRKGIASEFTAGRGIAINEELVISTNLEAGSGILFYNQPDNTLGLEIDMDEIKYNLADVASTGSYGDLLNTPTFSTGLTVTTATTGPIITIDNDEIDDRVQYDIENNITTDGNDKILSLYGYGVTNVIANPTGTAGNPLSKIQIDNTKYYIPYTSVEVNNPVSSTDSPLLSIEVDGDNYYVPTPEINATIPSGTTTSPLTNLKQGNDYYEVPKLQCVQCFKNSVDGVSGRRLYFTVQLFTTVDMSQQSWTWSEIFDMIPVGRSLASGSYHDGDTVGDPRWSVNSIKKPSTTSNYIIVDWGSNDKWVYKTDTISVYR